MINIIIHSIVINQILIVLNIEQSLDLHIDLNYRFIILLIRTLKLINHNNLFNIKINHRNQINAQAEIRVFFFNFNFRDFRLSNL